MEVKAHQTGKTEIIFPYLVIGFVESSVAGKSQSHGVFGNSLRGVIGYTHDADAKLRGLCRIYIIKSGAAHQYK